MPIRTKQWDDPREPDDGSVSSALVAERVRENGTDAEAATFEEIYDALDSVPGEGDVIMTMGAGDIYRTADQPTH